MEINVKLKQDIFNTFHHSGLAVEALNLIEEKKFLQARAVLAQILDEYRELYSLEKPIQTSDDVERHNLIVSKISEMESMYSIFMTILEEHELLRQ
jgi:hypothetical protein